MDQNFPNLNAFKQHFVNRLGEVEIIRQSLFDTMIYPLAGVAQLQFFQTPQGQGLSASPGNANAGKALTDTNMILAAQLPAPQGFWCDGIELQVFAGSSAVANTFALQIPSAIPAAAALTAQAGEHDVQRIYNSGALVFTVGAKDYCREAPLVRFPPSARREMDVTVSSNSATATTVIKAIATAGGRPYKLDPGVALMTGINFGVSLQWPVIVAMQTNNAAIRCILTGWLFRAVQ